MYEENQSVVIGIANPSSMLKKMHNALAYHRTREDLAASFIDFRFFRSKSNWANILTMALPQTIFHVVLQYILEKGRLPQEHKERGVEAEE